MNAFEIGTAIRIARRGKELTQAQLAAEAGLSRQTLIQLERGEYNEIGIRKVMSVLSVLDLRLEVGDPEHVPAPAFQDHFELTVQCVDEVDHRSSMVARERQRF